MESARGRGIVSVDEDAYSAIIESTADALGKYPFPAKLANLVPVITAPLWRISSECLGTGLKTVKSHSSS